MHGINNYPTNQPNNDYKADVKKTSESSTTSEINIYADADANNEIKDFSKNDGGYNDREVDGDPEECINQLENLKKRYEGKLSPEMINRIDKKIDNLRITEIANDIYGVDENQKLPPHKLDRALQVKLKSVKTVNDCIKLEKYFTEAKNEWISLLGDEKTLQYYQKIINSVYTRHEQLDPNFKRIDSLDYL